MSEATMTNDYGKFHGRVDMNGLFYEGGSFPAAARSICRGELCSFMVSTMANWTDRMG